MKMHLSVKASCYFSLLGLSIINLFQSISKKQMLNRAQRHKCNNLLLTFQNCLYSTNQQRLFSASAIGFIISHLTTTKNTFFAHSSFSSSLQVFFLQFYFSFSPQFWGVTNVQKRYVIKMLKYDFHLHCLYMCSMVLSIRWMMTKDCLTGALQW